MKNEIRISKNLALPVDTVTQAVAILAKRRMGKSYLARKLAEGFHAAGQQLVIIDPKGDWWGIRSSADGKSDGLPILIIGGEHGDIPLDAGAGETIAKLVVEERISVLLDLSELRKHEIATFMPAFMEPLYRLKAREQYRTPLMVLTDEADAIAPQKPQPNEARMLGAFNDLVRRGGQRGIGVTFITQRSAVLSKDVLTQAQILIALRVIAPQDLAAIKAWVDVHGTIEEQKTLMASLPSLPVGDAWVWSPGWPTDEGIFKRIHTLPIATFDSGATPKPGEKSTAPKRLADIDLEAVKRQMSETLDRAKAEDPKALRARIAQLEQQLHVSSVALEMAEDPSEPERVEVPVFDEAAFAVLAETATEALTAARVAVERASAVERDLGTYRAGMQERIRTVRFGPPISAHAPVVTKPKPAERPPISAPTSAHARPVTKAAGIQKATNGAGAALGKVERLILTVLAQQHSKPMTRERLALLVGYHANAKSFTNGLGALRGRGAVEGLTITDTGLAELGHYDQLPTGRRLLEWYCEHKLSGPEAKILKAIARSGAGLTREGLAADVEYHPNAKSFTNGLGRLRGLGLVEGLQLSRELR
jgi:hypothetical protein